MLDFAIIAHAASREYPYPNFPVFHTNTEKLIVIGGRYFQYDFSVCGFLFVQFHFSPFKLGYSLIEREGLRCVLADYRRNYIVSAKELNVAPHMRLLGGGHQDFSQHIGIEFAEFLIPKNQSARKIIA